jgi:hypothetical protein
MYAFFWRLNFIFQHFGILCRFHLHRQVPAHPEESIQHSEHGESLQARRIKHVCKRFYFNYPQLHSVYLGLKVYKTLTSVQVPS